MIQFILGGARSGKSRFAETQAKMLESQGAKVVYIATAQNASCNSSVESSATKEHDPEMVSRIARHQADRPAHWQTIESPIELAQTLSELDSETHCILVDCLTLWTLNLLEAEVLQAQKTALLNLLPRLNAKVILVSNEVGLGVVPMGKLTRTFVDELGWLHQAVAELADEVTFVTAGLPMKLKSIDG